MGGRVSGWMGRWMDGWMDGWMAGWMGGWIYGWTDEWMDKPLDGSLKRCVDADARWTNAWWVGDVLASESLYRLSPFTLTFKLCSINTV